MSTFSELVARPDAGVAWLLDIFDGTTTERYATAGWQAVVGQEYQARLVDVGTLQRGFGVDGPAVGTVTVRLDNTDGALDWLTAPSTVATRALRSTYTLTLLVHAPGDTSDFQTKVMGVFTALNYPRRDESMVTVELADRVFGDAAELRTRPTYADFFDITTTPGAAWAVERTMQVQMSFGNQCPATRFIRTAPGSTRVPLALYCTTLLDSVNTTTPTFWVANLVFENNGDLVSMPPTWTPPNAAGPITLFELQASSTIVKDGVSWRVHYVTLHIENWYFYTPVLAGSAAGLTWAAWVASNAPEDILDRLGPCTAVCWPGSSRSFTTPPDRFEATGWGVTGAEVAYDLLNFYSRLTASDIEATTFTEVRDAWPGNRVAGQISDGGRLSTVDGTSQVLSAESGQLRRVLGDIARSSQMDLVAGWSGKLRASGATATFTAIAAAAGGTLPVLVETRCLADSVKLRTPSGGERWAPFNRLFITGADGRLWGPYDNQEAITAWGKVVTKTMRTPMLESLAARDGFSQSFVNNDPAWARLMRVLPLESKVRPVITFEYGFEALDLEIGDYFVMSVTRGGRSALLDSYVDAIWRVESMNVHTLTGYVEVTAVWSSDLLTETAYLLDDETLHVRADSATYGGGGVVCIVDAGPNVQLTGGSLTTAGVVKDDILLLLQPGSGPLDFELYRALRITAVTSATDLDVDENVMAAGTANVTTWKILKGKLNLPSSGAGYANGSSMYGATANAGTYSSGSPANRFKAG